MSPPYQFHWPPLSLGGMRKASSAPTSLYQFPFPDSRGRGSPRTLTKGHSVTGATRRSQQNLGGGAHAKKRFKLDKVNEPLNSHALLKDIFRAILLILGDLVIMLVIAACVFVLDVAVNTACAAAGFNQLLLFGTIPLVYLFHAIDATVVFVVWFFAIKKLIQILKGTG